MIIKDFRKEFYDVIHQQVIHICNNLSKSKRFGRFSAFSGLFPVFDINDKQIYLLDVHSAPGSAKTFSLKYKQIAEYD